MEFIKTLVPIVMNSMNEPEIRVPFASSSSTNPITCTGNSRRHGLAYIRLVSHIINSLDSLVNICEYTIGLWRHVSFIPRVAKPTIDHSKRHKKGLKRPYQRETLDNIIYNRKPLINNNLWKGRRLSRRVKNVYIYFFFYKILYTILWDLLLKQGSKEQTGIRKLSIH